MSRASVQTMTGANYQNDSSDPTYEMIVSLCSDHTTVIRLAAEWWVFSATGIKEVWWFSCDL